MAYVKHEGIAHKVKATPQGNILTLSFLDSAPVLLTNGVNVYLDAECKMVIGKYPDYKTVYRNDAVTAKYNGYQLSNDRSVYVAPIPVVTFSATTGGTLDGDTVQEVTDYADLVIPEPTPNENYEFVGWRPEIPVAGVVENNQSFTAEFVYVPTLEEVKAAKTEELCAAGHAAITSGVVYDGKTYLYGQTEQAAVKKALEMAVQTGESVTVEYSDGKGKLMSDQLKELYIALEENEVSHKAYTGQLVAYVSALDDTDAVQAVVYGQELDAAHQALMETEIKDEMAVVLAYVDQLGYATAAEVQAISDTLEGLE